MKQPTHAALIALLFTAGLMLPSEAGCSKEREPPRVVNTRSPGQVLSPPPRTAASVQKYRPPQITARSIAVAVEQQLLLDPKVPSHRLDVSVHKHVVNLKGKVPDLRAKRRAVTVATGIKGVTSVVDQMKVLPALRRDAELKEAVDRALKVDPVVEKYEIKTWVTGSVVSLTGMVDSWTERRLAERVVEGVRGVAQVNNAITLQHHERRTDPDIEADVKAVLRHDALVDDSLIRVAVKEGRVTLSGSVGSAAERTRAGYDVWVAGVRSVDTSPLQVNWLRRQEMRRKSRPLPSDREIVAAVRRALLRDPRVKATRPAITVRTGTVYLTGYVGTLRARRAARRDAENTVGVYRVVNMLKVKPLVGLSDRALAGAVKAALDRESALSPWPIRVRVHEGDVFLSGAVPSQFDKQLAERAVSAVRGVLQIINGLSVTASRPKKADWELLADIKSSLFWSPQVREQDVLVRVQDGVATLRGTVDSWPARTAAAVAARRAGAWRVQNRLEIGSRMAE